jgi:hypothetical protein
MELYFHRHSQGTNVKSFAPASEGPHNGTPASEQRDKELHLREEMALEMEAEIRNFRESSLQDPKQVLS